MVPADLAFVLLVSASLAAGGPRWPGSRPPLVLLTPVLAVALASFATAAPLRSAGPELFRTAYSMLTLAALSSLPLDRDRLRRAMAAWVATSAAVCLLGLAGVAAALSGGPTLWGLAARDSTNLPLVRMASVLGANALPLYLVVSLAPATALGRTGGSERQRRGALWAIVLSGVASLLSFSRGIVGFAIASCLLAFDRALAPRPLREARWPLAAATLLALAAATVLTLRVFPEQLSSEQRTRFGSGPARPAAYAVLHQAALRMALAHPVFGVGPGRFGARLEDFARDEERAAAWPPVVGGTAPHNTWLGLAAEGGLVLLLSWLAVCGWVVRRLRRQARDNPLSACLLFSLAGLAVDGLCVDLVHLKLIWAGLGLGLIAHVVPSSSGASRAAGRIAVVGSDAVSCHRHSRWLDEGPQRGPSGDERG